MADRTPTEVEHIKRTEVENVLRGLFLHAEGRLSAKELEHVSFLREEAATMLGNVEKLTNDLGCLVAADGDHKHSSDMAGNFRQPEDVARLLWTISGQISIVKAMLNVSEWADEAIERRVKKAPPDGRRS